MKLETNQPWKYALYSQRYNGMYNQKPDKDILLL